MKFVSVEEAKSARGVRLAVAASIPSPWSEAAKGTFAVQGIEALLVRYSSRDEAVRQWMGWHNVPVLFIDDEPPRTHWSEILESAERLGGTRRLTPEDPDERARMFGLSHELLGEGGLVWNGRMLVIHRGLVTDGQEGFPIRVARYLAPKYGYAPERVDAARARVLSIFHRFADMLGGREHLIGDDLTAIDIHLATALAPFAQMPESQCIGMAPAIRHAFATADAEMLAGVPPSLRAHRDRIYERYLGLPIEL